MASSKPSKAYQGGSGGPLNGADGTITDYYFEDRQGKKPYRVIVVDFQQDGIAYPYTRTFFFGGVDGVIQPDKKTVIGGKGPLADETWVLFLNSLVKAGLDEAVFPDEHLNYECLLGLRISFKQVIDEGANARVGKKKVGDKEFDRTTTVATAILGGASGGTKAATNGSGQPLATAPMQSARDVLAARQREAATA